MPNPFLGRTTQSSNGGLLYRPVHARTVGPGATAVGPWRSVGGQGLQAIGQALMAAGSGGWQNFGPGFLAGLQNAQEDEARREERTREDQLFGMQVDQYEAEKQEKSDAKAEAARKKAARDAAIDTLPVDDATKAMLKAVDATPGYGDLVQKPKGPQSDLGRLKADMDAGLVSPADYAAAVAKANARPQGPVTWSDIKDNKGNVIGQRSTTGEVKYFSNGPGSQQGPFGGTSIDAQSYNIVLTGDPSTPEYAAAYQQLAMPKTTYDANTGQMVSVQPDMSWARKPGQQPPPAGRPGPTVAAAASLPNPNVTTTQVPGATITSRQPDINATTPTQRNDYKKQTLALDNLDSAINDYESALDKYGAVETYGEGKGILENAYANLLIQMKEAANLGALTGPDMSIMGQMIIPPNSLKQASVLGAGGVKTQLGQARAQLKQKRENLNKLYNPGATTAANDPLGIR